MTSPLLLSLIWAAVLAVVTCYRPTHTTLVIESADVLVSLGVKVHLKFSNPRTNPGAVPQLFCEPTRDPDTSIVRGIIIKRLPVLTKLGLMVRFAYRDGNLQACQLIPAASAKNLDPTGCMMPERPPIPTSPICPPGWTSLEPFCYLVANETGTWIEGQRFCESRGANLATILNGFQQTMLADLLTEEDTWIGLNVTGTNRTFTWQDETPLNYFSWAEKEPTNSAKFLVFDAKEDCVGMRQSSYFNWNDDQCSRKKRFLCSIQLEHSFTTTKRCPEGWNGFAHSCYYFSANKTTWKESDAHCQQMHARLASPNDETHHYFLTDQISESHWLGLNDIDEEGNYKSPDGTESTFTQWGNNQPSNSSFSMLGLGNEDEDCVEMRKNFDFKWNDEKCSTNNYYICEKEVSHI